MINLKKTTALRPIPKVMAQKGANDHDDDAGGLCEVCQEFTSFFGIREQDYVDGNFDGVMDALRGFKAAHDSMQLRSLLKMTPKPLTRPKARASR